MGEHEDFPRVVKAMGRRPKRRRWYSLGVRWDDEVVSWLFAICFGIAGMLILSGCAVSLSFQPASFEPASSKAQTETRAK